MHISSLRINNVRCFAGAHDFPLAKGINVFVGRNSSGKSTLLRCLSIIQTSNVTFVESAKTMLRKGTHAGAIGLSFAEPDERLAPISAGLANGTLKPQIQCHLSPAGGEFEGFREHGAKMLGQKTIPAREPDNFIFPFFSRRKAAAFNHVVNAATAYGVTDDLTHLYAKIARLCMPQNDMHSEFVRCCDLVLGHRVSVSQSDLGSEAGLWISQTQLIPLTVMGEGTSNVLGLLVNLCLATNHVFLIEELENDIHPAALKALLDLIELKSQTCQFFISTHSNIVLRHLGAMKGAKVFSCTMSFEGRMPTSEVTTIGESEIERQEVLRALGYDPVDFGLWKGYLLLEESSAEAIINRVLIPSFAPKLVGRLRTISAGGATNVEPSYSDFHRLFVFTHTSKLYHENAWVRVDGDKAGEVVVRSLSAKFPSASGKFRCYSKTAFEHYYPKRFLNEVEVALGASSKESRREAKRLLCQTVLGWATENPQSAKTEFRESAAEVIADLRELERDLG